MSIEIEKIPEYNENLSFLIEQYKNKEKFTGMLKAIGLEYDKLENAMFEIRDLFWLTTAEGVQLDVIGNIHGEPRLGKSDANYRLSIGNRIIVNSGSGEAETIILALRSFYGATDIKLQRTGIAGLQIVTDVLLTFAQYNEIERIIAAGVGLYLSVGSAPFFAFDDNVNDLGFGKLSDDDEVLTDASGDPILDASGNTIYISYNISDPNAGGKFCGIWQKYV